MKKITTKTAAETQQIAHEVLSDLLSTAKKSSARILALSGDLGAGKTTFVQGIARALDITEPITSPTFVLANTYTANDKKLVHVDCYRLESAEDASILDFTQLFTDPEAIVCIEWPERIKDILPKDARWITFEYGEKSDERMITT